MTLQNIYKVIYSSDIRITENKYGFELFKGSVNDIPEELMELNVLSVEANDFLKMEIIVEEI